MADDGPTAEATAYLAPKLQAAYPQLSTGECVELAQKIGGVGNVHDWRRGTSVQESRPPVGTPVSTFGWKGDSETYAYGGSGTRGIGRDHAGIVAGYSSSGVWLLNQWHGQKPVYTHYSWQGQGEHGGANYYTIGGPGGALPKQIAQMGPEGAPVHEPMAVAAGPRSHSGAHHAYGRAYASKGDNPVQRQRMAAYDGQPVTVWVTTTVSVS